ncbi:general transcription factor IIF subunit 2-like [Sinocyclocheilus grahami]|uniref:general transcription factor IIF subunit 2-like n=1 Tax=Sinocyclocheilus grahami TaxID=75366 RepID=UPI0007AC636E|nr:PREDICTED: general transcription factor IIF subunit 2-like [Sinocyclocheilus grahami]
MSDKGQDVDLTRAKQNTGVWLVKVPKYLSQQWAKASGRGEVGKLKIGKAQGKTAVSFSLNEELTDYKLALEGMVVQRAECRPAVSESYMKLKKLQIEESTKPLRFSQKLEKAITTNYKPVSNHSHNVEYEKRKKEEGKRARADKQKVLEMLFSAFEKHQYYNIRDLVDITKQPVIYLKEILREIGVYNSRGPHKSTWELKPEYRHYEEGQEDEEEKIE